jgi:hypothetical protein
LSGFTLEKKENSFGVFVGPKFRVSREFALPSVKFIDFFAGNFVDSRRIMEKKDSFFGCFFYGISFTVTAIIMVG